MVQISNENGFCKIVINIADGDIPYTLQKPSGLGAFSFQYQEVAYQVPADRKFLMTGVTFWTKAAPVNRYLWDSPTANTAAGIRLGSNLPVMETGLADQVPITCPFYYEFGSLRHPVIEQAATDQGTVYIHGVETAA